ncbi:MAG: tetratricopeptide repeat protein, partial [Gemmatimonadota bacterium]
MIAVLQAGFGLSVLLAPILFRLAGHAYLVLWPLLGGTAAGAFALRFLHAVTLVSLPAALFFAMPPFLSRLIVPREPGSAIGIGLSSGLALTGLALGFGIGGMLIVPALGSGGGHLMGVALAGLAAAGTVLIRQCGLEGHGALASALAGGSSTGFPLRREPEPTPAEVTRGGTLAGGMVLFGFAAWAYLIIWFRTLIFATGETMTGRAIVGAIFLLGVGLGAFMAAGLVDRVGVPCAFLTAIVTTSSLVAYLSMRLAPQTAFLYLRLTPLLDSPGTHFLPPILAALALMLPTCMLIGAALPMLPMAAGLRQRPEVGAASLIALGTVIAEALIPLVVVPAFGLRPALSLAAAVGLLAAILFLGGVSFRRPNRRTTVSFMLLALMVAVGLFSARWDPQLISSAFYRYGARAIQRFGSPSGYLSARRSVQPIHYHEGVNSTVMVEQSFVQSPGNTPVEVLALTVDGRMEASTGDDIRTQVLQGQLPILLHGPTDRVLQIGYLNGVTAGSVLRHPVKSLAIIENEPALFEADRAFSPYHDDPLEDSRVVRIVDSARARLLADQTLYDVILIPSVKPWWPPSAALITSEGLGILKARLAKEGIVALRFEVDSAPDGAIRAALRTVMEAFDSILRVRLATNDLLLVGSAEPLALDIGWLRNVIDDNRKVTADLARVSIVEPAGLVLVYRLDRAGLRAVVGEGPRNGDASAPVETASVRHLGVHDNAQLFLEIDAAWPGLGSVLKNYGALPQDRAEFLFSLAKAYLGLAGDPVRALGLAADLEGVGETARARWVRGESLFQQRDLNGALEEWRAVLDLDPDNLDALFSLGTYYLDGRDYWQAETHLERAARAHPDSAVVLYHFGRTLYFLGKYDDAIRDLLRARELAGNRTRYPLVDYLVGVGSLRLERYEQAGESLQTYLDWAYKQTALTRLEVDAHLKLAEALENQGKRLEALRQRQKAESLRQQIQSYASRQGGPVVRPGAAQLEEP